jgi:N-acetylglucosaminyldiphosphoundecaprenol N-acetyl-beta-D-mannosaminyltransferase
MLKSFHIYSQPLDLLPNQSKLLICTLNAHCYNITRIDPIYKEALSNSEILIPDGISVVWAIKWLTGKKIKKIAGADLFFYELERLQKSNGKCFFLGSTNSTLNQIKEKIQIDYPNIQIDTYSPPFKSDFTEEDNIIMLKLINAFQPDVLMIGMTAPKQEKWAYKHFDQILAGHICSIGAVFDFYGGAVNRAPNWMIKNGMEWMYRFYREPKRMWRRYLLGNILFIGYVIYEKLKQKFSGTRIQ